ncbi:MAG TPA: glycine--tRNA ligase [Candidatus Andersenbacteria bacterium]|nr:glycine--tRNA ligase [Candidatus Andersenbacteria bacterium]
MTVALDTIVRLAKQRGFIFPGSEMYGGLANSWDYGPLGAQLKKNIKDEWWRIFVERRSDMYGIDPAIIMNPKVWEASGHVAEFTDPLVECKKCHQRFRADQIAGVCPNCEGTDFSPAQKFNLLFKTFIGPKEDSSTVAYLRGELAQAMFVDYPYIRQTMRAKLPFGIAAQGKVFRNEITPGNFTFRTREFDLMEFEYFVKEDDWEQWFEYWRGEIQAWLKHLGVDMSHVHEVEIPDSERAHYSKRTIDFEYEYPFGQKELYGLAYRTDFDLKRHAKATGAVWGDLPHVIEPTFGVDRSVLVTLLEAYDEEKVEGETRVILRLPAWAAPVQVAVLPLSKKPELAEVAQKIAQRLAARWSVDYDETQSIGKRYRRQDEIGTPYCVTVDFDSLQDQQVTIRERDSMRQERVGIAALEAIFYERLATH